ncbi:MAG: ABC transporter substrate-binding protein [Mycobacteriales bacterium]
MKVRRVYVAAALAGALAAAGCANNEESGTAAGGGQSSGAATFNLDSVKKDDALAGQVPDAVKADGKMTIGTNLPYAPNEFKDASGKIVGFDIDLASAVAKKLGLTPEFKESSFDNLLSPATGTKYEFSISSFTDKKEREQKFDFVTYFSAGTAWASKDKSFNPDDPCGHKVAVQSTTAQDTDDLPARQKKCGGTAIQIQRYDSQDEATSAVVTGKAEAMLADSPIVDYAIKQTGGQLSRVGQTYDSAPYGILLPKNGGTLKDAVLGAVKALMADGTYKAILDKWGLAAGAITNPVINGAVA